MACLLTNDLRDAVLQYALEGCLTRTLNSDTPVNNTIELYKQEKESILTSKNMKDRNSFSDINNDEILFNIPETWSWIRINDIGVYKKGPFGSALTKSMFVKKDVNTVKVYEQKNAIQKDATLGSYYITEEYYNKKMKGFSVVPGDIIVSCAGTIGEIYIVPEGSEMGIINQALMRMNIVPSVNIDYFMLVFNHILKEEARKNSGGTAIKNIPPFEVFKAMPIPIPPIEEQARIVAKVDEIMAKIDEYEKLENQLVKLKEQFPQDMKDSLLRSAFEGRMTTQNKEESVDTCIKSLIKNSKKFSLISQDEFNIPHNWTCFKFSDIFDIRNGFTPLRSNPDFWNNKDVPWFTIEDIRSQGRFITRTEQYISKKALSNNTKRILPKDTVLLCCTASVGEFAYSRIELTTNQQFNGLVVRDYVKSYINPLYVYYFVQTLKDKLIDNSGKTTFNFLSVTKLGKILIPIPPIEEQQRIVDKLDEVLPLVDKLTELN